MFKRVMKSTTAYVDTDMVAFHVDKNDVNAIVEYLISAIVTNCLTEFGETPDIIE